MSRQDIRNRHPFHAPRSLATVSIELGVKPYKRGLKHCLKARIARIRLALGV